MNQIYFKKNFTKPIDGTIEKKKSGVLDGVLEKRKTIGLKTPCAQLLSWKQSHEQWPTRLLCPWDFPGKNPGTGVGCHFLIWAGGAAGREEKPLIKSKSRIKCQ